MASTILLSDNGVSSGSAGLKETAGDDGKLLLQTTTASGTATTAVTIDNSQNVGLGVTPSAWGSGYSSLQLNATASITGVSSKILRLMNNSYVNAAGQDTYITTAEATAYLQASGGHAWYSAPSGTAGTTVSYSTKMVLDASGNLIVGATATDSGAKTRVVFGASQNGIQIKDSNDTSGAAFLIFQNGSNSNFATISRDGTNNSLSIGTVSAITFPATQVASAGANTLDDYEEGTWTPSLYFGVSQGVSSYNYQNGTYTKIGNTVTVRCYIAINTKSAATGSASLVGLPFPTLNATAHYQSGTFYMGSSTITGAPMNYIAPNATGVTLGQSNGIVGFTPTTNANFPNGADLIFQMTYFTA